MFPIRSNANTRTKTQADQDGVWTDEKRIEAVAAYISLGSMAKVRDVTEIPLNTLWAWKKGIWWEDVENTLRSERNDSDSSKLSNIVDKTLVAITDRIENGDYILDKRTGEIHRVDIPAKDLNKIASTLLDRRMALDKIEEKASDDSDSSADKLQSQLGKLAVAFSKFVDSKKKEEKVIEAVLE